MCNSQNEQLIRDLVMLIRDVVIEKIAAGLPFTAYDITTEARHRGATEQHWAMKNTVHAMFSNGEFSGYDRTSIQTPTGPAWCYHPLGFDLSSYVANIGGTAPSPSVTQPAPNQPIDNSASCNEFERKQATDAEGRLPIWSDMLRSIGLTRPGTVVFVGVDTGSRKLIVANSVPNSIDNYAINKDGRIRIGCPALATIYNSQTGAYNVKVNYDENRIEIEAI
jgi:hypothetical protein